MKLGASSKYKRHKITYKIDTDDGSLTPICTFRGLFPNTAEVLLCKIRNRNVILKA